MTDLSGARNSWKPEAALLRWRVIPSPRPPPETFAVIGHNLNGAKMAVGLEVGWLVGDRILAAQFLLNFGKGVGHVANLERRKCASPVASAIRSSTLSPV